MNNKKILKNKAKKAILSIAIASSFSAFAANEVNNLPTNRYDCTPSEVKLFMSKQTESMFHDSGIRNWEETKTMTVLAKTNPTMRVELESTGNPAQDAKLAKQATAQVQAEAGEEQTECDMMFAEYAKIDLGGGEVPDVDIGDLISGGLDSLVAMAEKEMADMMNAMKEALNDMCSRVTPDAVTEFVSDNVNKSLNREYGYDMDDVKKGTIYNDVVNDALKEEFNDSDAKLLNVFDDDLDDNRERYIKRQKDNFVDDQKDTVSDAIQDEIDDLID
jgi:hypothetical protein